MVVSRLAIFRGMLVRGFPPPYRGTGHAFDRGNDEWSGRNHEGTPPTSSEKLLDMSIFVPIARAGRGRHAKL